VIDPDQDQERATTNMQALIAELTWGNTNRRHIQPTPHWEWRWHKKAEQPH